MWIESAIFVALLSTQSPQSQPTEPPSREALARLLAKSHHKGARLPEMVSFKATLSVLTLGRDKDNIEITIDSSFRKDVPRGAKRRPMPMIRYSLDEGGKRLERGRDAYGYWFCSDGKVTPLDDARGTTDRELVRQQINLAKQLLSVVNPADVLQRLEGKKVRVTEGKLPVGNAKARYWIANGELPDYPFYTLSQEKGKQRRADVCLYVDKTTGMLKAVQATSPTGNKELVLFGEYGHYPLVGAGETTVSLPTVLKISQHRGKKYELLVTIRIPSVSLNPKLTAADFQRTK